MRPGGGLTTLSTEIKYTGLAKLNFSEVFSGPKVWAPDKQGITARVYLLLSLNNPTGMRNNGLHIS